MSRPKTPPTTTFPAISPAPAMANFASPPSLPPRTGSCGGPPISDVRATPIISISLQRSGTGRMQQNGASCELQAGDIGIVDGARPFSVDVSECSRSRHRRDPVGAAAQPRALAARSPDRRDGTRSRAASNAARNHRASGRAGLRLGRGSGIAGRQSVQSSRAADRARRCRAQGGTGAALRSRPHACFRAPPSRRSGAFAADTRRTHAGVGAHDPQALRGRRNRHSAVRCSTFGWMPAGARSPIRAAAA